jgi:hypothetical protein
MSAAQDMVVSNLLNAAQSTRQQRQASSPAVLSPRLELGMVVAQSGPIHVVDVLGAGGQAVARIAGVVSWGGPPRGVGAQVVLAFVGGGPIPYILGGGGSSGVDANILSGDPITVVSMQVFGV